MTGDTATETLLRNFTNSLFRAAGLDVALARSMHLRDAALNSFTNTGNPVFVAAIPPVDRRRGGNMATEENRKGFDAQLNFVACPGLLATFLPALMSVPARAEGFTAQQRAEIIEVVRVALKADPSILRDAIAALQEQDELQQEAAARAAIPGLADALVRTPGDPAEGNPQGDVTVVEFFDVRCPDCRRMLPVLAGLLAQDHNLRVVYKDIPILGPGSVLGAKALLAAEKQDGYLKLKTAVMTGPADITPDTLRAEGDQGRAGLEPPGEGHGRPDGAEPPRRQSGSGPQARHQRHTGLCDRHPDAAGALDLAALQGAVAEARKAAGSSH